jgi:hypothetical protein
MPQGEKHDRQNLGYELRPARPAGVLHRWVVHCGPAEIVCYARLVAGWVAGSTNACRVFEKRLRISTVRTSVGIVLIPGKRVLLTVRSLGVYLDSLSSAREGAYAAPVPPARNQHEHRRGNAI